MLTPQVKLEDLEGQYAEFCRHHRVVKTAVSWPRCAPHDGRQLSKSNSDGEYYRGAK